MAENWQDSGHLHERGHRQGQYVIARFFDRGSYKIGNVRIITTEYNTHLISAEARARRVRNSRVTRQAHRASEIKDDQHWQFGLRVIPPKDAIATDVARTPSNPQGGSSGIQWPGRQEWAERRRDPNWFDHIEVSNRLADYATQAEINDTMAAIKDLWRALGRKMRSASDIEALQFRYRRAGVNRAFKAMREGEIPGAPLECRYGVPPALLAPFDVRRKAALEVAVTQEQRKHLTIAASNARPAATRVAPPQRQLEFRVRHADERCRPSFPWSARDTKGT